MSCIVEQTLSTSAPITEDTEDAITNIYLGFIFSSISNIEFSNLSYLPKVTSPWSICVEYIFDFSSPFKEPIPSIAKWVVPAGPNSIIQAPSIDEIVQIIPILSLATGKYLHTCIHHYLPLSIFF